MSTSRYQGYIHLHGVRIQGLRKAWNLDRKTESQTRQLMPVSSSIQAQRRHTQGSSLLIYIIGRSPPIVPLSLEDYGNGDMAKLCYTGNGGRNEWRALSYQSRQVPAHKKTHVNFQLPVPFPRPGPIPSFSFEMSTQPFILCL